MSEVVWPESMGNCLSRCYSAPHITITQIALFYVYSTISSFDNKISLLHLQASAVKWQNICFWEVSDSNPSFGTNVFLRFFFILKHTAIFIMSILCIFLKSLHLNMIVASEQSCETIYTVTYFFLSIEDHVTSDE